MVNLCIWVVCSIDWFQRDAELLGSVWLGISILKIDKTIPRRYVFVLNEVCFCVKPIVLKG